ncbi:lachesin [Biomphalaria glabrata]
MDEWMVIWRRASDPNPLTIGSDVYVGASRYAARNSPDDKEWRLIIYDVRDSDAGVYECQISSKKKLIYHVLLRVEDGATRATPEREDDKYLKQDHNVPDLVKSPDIFISGTTFVEKGDPIYLACNASGHLGPPEDLDWFKDGQKLSPDGIRQVKINKFKVPASRTLVSNVAIKHSRMEDAGTYVCRSSNLVMTSLKVHVLNAGSINVRRGTSATDKVDETGGKVLKDRDIHNDTSDAVRNSGSTQEFSARLVYLASLLTSINVLINYLNLSC